MGNVDASKHGLLFIFLGSRYAPEILN